MTRKQILFAFTFAAAVVILIALLLQLDIETTAAHLRAIGIAGAILMFADLAFALAGPLLAWHILMRVEAIPVRLNTTLASGLMGVAVNLISPLMYFGGEGVRTFHIAGVTGVPRPRVLATIVAGEFQALIALTASMLAALLVVTLGRSLPGVPLFWMTGGAAALAAIVGLLLGLLLLDLRLAARLLAALGRLGVFSRQLEALREAAFEVEVTVRKLLIHNKKKFLTAQLLSFSSPFAQFVLPALFFWFLRLRGQSAPTPSLLQLSVLFVLVQLLFMLPTTPAGLGVYEAGIVGVFHLLGWSASAGAAYAILVRLDDVLFSLTGAALLGHFGLMRALRGSRPV